MTCEICGKELTPADIAHWEGTNWLLCVDNCSIPTEPTLFTQ